MNRQISGYCDEVGRLYCAPCAYADEWDLESPQIHPVYRDVAPHCGETCDRCGIAVKDANIIKSCPACGGLRITGGRP